MTGCVLVVVASGAVVLAAAEDAFKGTVKIELSHDRGRAGVRKVTIEDASTIAKFIAAIKLEKTPPCACDHVHFAVFTARDGTQTKVSICDHCFDFNGKYFQMPPEFWKLFTQHLDGASGPATASAPASGPASAASR